MAVRVKDHLPRKQTAARITTEETIRKLFPKRVVEKAKHAAAESEARTR
jgi:hypothetical protein